MISSNILDVLIENLMKKIHLNLKFRYSKIKKENFNILKPEIEINRFLDHII
jgi:hypothetical protein